MKSAITVFTDSSAYGKAALAHAQKLAQIFDATINPVFPAEKPDFRAIFSAAEEGEVLCFVMPVAHSKKATFFNINRAKKWIGRSRVPVIAVGNAEPKENHYQQIVLPLDTNCQDKELALWASYFPTFLQKNCTNIPKENLLIHIIFNQYKNEIQQKKVQNNIDYVTKMFNSIAVSYKLHPFSKIDNIHTFGLEFGAKLENSMMLLLMTQHYSFIDLLFGPVENRILGNRAQVPVLCLNARDDIFMLCQ